MNAPHAGQDDIAKTLGLATSTAQRNWRNRRWRRWGGLAAVVTIGVAALLLWNAGERGAAPHYQTQEARRGDLTVMVTATGNLQPTNQVDVGIEVSGTVASVEVDYNDAVRVGQVLARLDTSRLEAQAHKAEAGLDAARARVTQMQATLTETGTTLARLRAMHKKTGGKVPSQQDLDTADAAFKRAQTEVASAQAAVAESAATLKLTQTDLTKAVIRSPIDGIVLVRAVEPGQTLAASFQAPVLFTLAEDLTKMELHVDVDEADVGQVKQGQTATFSVDAYPDRRFPAQVAQVRYGAQAVEGVTTYKTVLNVDNTDLALRPGMTATADILVQKVGDALLIPNAALRFTPPAQTDAATDTGSVVGMLLPRPPRSASKTYTQEPNHGADQRVWALRDGQAHEVAIKVGATNGVLTQVLSGAIEPGMALITDVVNPTATP
ncbi:MAG: efflux RND transporter periplasmic adaptor subunit [Gammaproteobacteria bacterium]|nr:efflux RND transporter periplasmic adaptor subunit [Gammaproteobacteria bacterium]